MKGDAEGHAPVTKYLLKRQSSNGGEKKVALETHFSREKRFSMHCKFSDELRINAFD
jgi:hypothetical protein